MKKWISALVVVALAILFVMIFPSRPVVPFLPPGSPSRASTSSSFASPSTPSAFEDVLAAHGGGKEIAAITAFTVEAVRLSVTSPTDFFERQVAISTDGAKFKRRSAEPLGLRTEIEWLDERGTFHATAIVRTASGEVINESLSSDDERRHAVKSLIETSSLLPILQRCADARVRVVATERAPQGLDKFTLATSDGVMIIYADRLHLIRRVEIGDKVFQFTDYRAVGPLRLPFIQRLSVGSHLFYEWFISTIDLHPIFPPGFFNQAD